MRKKGTSLNDADISLMYVILRNSVVQKPKNGWGKHPEENDIGIADDIERIHQCRNLFVIQMRRRLKQHYSTKQSWTCLG